MKACFPFATAVIAATSLADVARATDMAVVTSDDCILTIGRSADVSPGFALPVRFIDIERPEPAADGAKSALTPIATALAVKLVETAFESGVSYLNKKANPDPKTAERMIGVDMFRVANEMEVLAPTKDDPEKTKTVRPVFLNPALRCLTVVTASAPIQTEAGAIRTADLLQRIAQDQETVEAWTQETETNGLSDETAGYRLAKAGIAVLEGGSLGTILELRLEVTADGSAFRYVPVYFDVMNFATEGKEKRDIGVTIKVSSLGTSSDNTVALASFHANQLSAVTGSGGNVGVSVQSSKAFGGFGPTTVEAVLGRGAWSKFAMPSAALPQSIQDLLNLGSLDGLQGNAEFTPFVNEVQRLQTAPFTYTPVNISVSFEESTEASRVVTFLDDFVKDNDALKDQLEKSTLKALGLQSDADALAELVALKQKEIDAAEAHLAVFKADPDNLLDAKKEWFDKVVADREQQIAEKKAELAALQFGQDTYVPTSSLDLTEPDVD
ncbi:hypothetical protein TM1040_2079 [Ruegeria sp. TM1040]|uniref:hypothetical protein n=1 Tax=Ruegeria sp. (strain TM1040) TaxID=292414 RepID=UPI0000462F74|nr:hypothetical protein [Ruegeria sp. TM1040]ABF64811.1 hypothetical protein TM1040_2079 [Ruegeria sp. TM1040]